MRVVKGHFNYCVRIEFRCVCVCVHPCVLTENRECMFFEREKQRAHVFGMRKQKHWESFISAFSGGDAYLPTSVTVFIFPNY